MASFRCPFLPEVYFLSFSPWLSADLRYSIHWFHSAFKDWNIDRTRFGIFSGSKIIIRRASLSDRYGSTLLPGVSSALLCSFAFLQSCSSGPSSKGSAALDYMRVQFLASEHERRCQRIETFVSVFAAMMSTSQGINNRQNNIQMDLLKWAVKEIFRM